MAHAARLNLRMQKELKLLLTDPPPGVSVLPSADDSSSSFSLSNIEARIEGPEGTVYAKGVFSIKIHVPERYPFQPPNVIFITPIYHPNIDNGGRICLDILNLPPKGAWQPSLNIATVLTSIGLLLSEPNPDDGLMCETSREYKYNRQQFDQKARSWTEKYANAAVGTDNNVGVLANSNMLEAEVSDAKTEDIVDENGSSRKKCRPTYEKLHLRSAASIDGFKIDDKENIQPSNRLSLSRSLSHPTGAAKSVPCQQSMISGKSLPLQDIQDEYKNKPHFDRSLNIMDTAIVSDSEESEEEDNRSTKFRLSLGREQMAERWKSQRLS